MNVNVSVIVPVFNSESYIVQCVESLLVQTISNCEFIFINDGSTDGSLEILEKFQKKDNRIVIVNQKNQGVSAARNAGIKISKGKYLGFIDSDDYVQEDFFYRLFETANQTNSQIVVSNFNTEIDGVIIKSKPLFEINKQFASSEIKQKIVPFFIEQDLMNTACNKLYLAELIKFNGINFPVGVSIGEDGLFNLQVFYKSNSVYFIDYNGYFYRDVVDSATRNCNRKDFFIIALNVFQIDYEKQFGILIENVNLVQIKSKRLITTVISLIHMYMNPQYKISQRNKIKYIRNMVYNETVQFALRSFWSDLKINKSAYHRFILYCMKYKLILGLLMATTYSTFKNKK